MTDMIQTRHRSGAIVSPPQDTTRQSQSSPPSSSSSSSSSINNIHTTMNSSRFPRNSSDLHTHTKIRTPTSSSSSNSSNNFSSNYNSNSSVSYSSLQQQQQQQQQQSRPPLATLRPNTGSGGGSRLRSGSNPPVYRVPAIGSSISFHDNIYAQRHVQRENSNSSNGSASIVSNDSLGTVDTHSGSFLGEAGDKHGASPRSSPGVFRSGGSNSQSEPTFGGPTRARAVSSSGYSAREQSNILAGAITELSLNTQQLTKGRSTTTSPNSSYINSNSINNASKATSPVQRTHSHSISAPSVYSSKISSHSPSPSTNSPTPPPPRYSTKPVMPVNSSQTASTSTTSSTSTNSTALPSTGLTPSSGTPNGQSNTLLPATSAVDLAGKRLREQQLQDRFKAAQSFIERTVGQPLPSNDLQESLKDGVILCRLANRLRPGTVLQISLKNLPFLKMENISNFLNAARQLGVQSSDLFQTVDLYEGKDMTQVVSTILTLERVVGGVARMVNKRPGPNPHVASESTPAPQTGEKGVLGVTRMRSKTAHTPSVASNTASIRPSSSSFYAAQVRKLEEDSIRFASGYDRLEATTFKPKDPRHQSTPVIGRATPPITKNSAVHLPSLNDNSVAAENTSFGSDEDDTTLVEALNRREQRDLVFGLGSSLTSEQSGSIPKSASGPILPIGSKSSALDMTRRKKKSISLDPQAANAVMGTPGYRNGLASPISPGMLPQSVSHNAISNLSSPTTPRPSSQQTSIKHARYSSDRTIDGAMSRSGVGSPVSSRSTTPVQGLRKSTNSFEPLREKLELIENEIPVSTYQLGNCIGRGQFGSVYKALNLVTGQMVAVKRIKIDGLKEEEREMLMQEVDLLKSLAHPSIVKYEGFIKTDSYLNIILEFAENGSLLTTLKIFGTFSEQLVVAYVVKILEGLVYLHGKEVVHCDLKAANILTTKNGNVKLSDFGVSLNLKVKEADFGAVAGTPNWMAPEVIELKGASPASDIWSLGCTIIELLTGAPPYADLLAMTTLFRIVEDERPPLPNNLSMDLLDFLCQCFQKDPALRPSARALGRHNWIKRNFTSKELKPMDSLPFLRRKFPEPRDKSLLTVAAEESKGNASRRALTPSGLTTGAPPPAASASATMQINGRSTRRGSVDSASAYYASYTVPAPTNIPDKFQEGYRGVGVGGVGEKEENQHRFVKSSFAKPVECRWCHRFAKKAVICQDCNMVFHREECPDAVGNTCFPGPHLSYFQSPSPAPSVPNLKTLNSGKSKGGSRPTSRASQINTDDRSRSVTPSQGLSSRPCRTPPPSTFMKRETTTINENREQRRVVSPQPPLPLAINHRAMSPEGYSVQTEQNNLSRPSSRQSESPTSPTFSGLRNIFSSPRRFSFAKKTTHPLPTSSSSASPLPSQNARQQAGTPDSGKVLRQPPVTPPKALPVPITGNKNSSAGKVYRGREQLPGPLDPFDENKDSSYNYSRSHQRPTVTSIFSSSAPPVNSEYSSGRRSVNSTTPGDDESHDDEKTESDEDEHKDIHDMDEEDIEALLIPSLIKSPRSSIDSGNQVVVTNGGGHHRVNSQSIGQALSQQTHGQDTQAGIANNKRYDSSSPVPRNNPTVTFDSPASVRSALHQQNPQQQQYLGRTLLNNGYNSSGSSSAAFTSSYSSQSNHGSSVSSIGSIAALLEEEERMMNENRPQENKSGSTGAVNGHSKNGMLGVSSAYQLANQTPQSHHVGIRTMLNRFSASGKDQNNPYNNSGTNDSHNGSVNAPEKEARHAAKVSAYTAAAAARHQIQAPTQYQNQLSQSHAGIRSIHPLEQQQYQPSSGSKSEFSPGYESQSHIQSHGSGSEYTNGSANGWRASSPSNINYSSMGNTAQPSFSMTDHIYNDNNNNVNAAALKRGGKVIRRSMGVALEKERWD